MQMRVVCPRSKVYLPCDILAFHSHPSVPPVTTITSTSTLHAVLHMLSSKGHLLVHLLSPVVPLLTHWV
jgi:hypothetical protein